MPLAQVNRPLKVMHVIGGGKFFGRSLPIGGAAAYLFLLLDALRGDSFEHVLVFFFEGPSARTARERGFTVHVTPKRFGKDPTLAFRLAGLIRRENADVVSTHLTDADFYGRLAARMSGRRAVVSTMHSFVRGTMAHGKERRFRETLSLWHEVRLSSLSDRIVTVCRALADEMEQMGVDRRRLVAVPPGIDPACFKSDGSSFRQELGIDTGTRVIGTVGRLVPAKNYPALLDIAARLTATHKRSAFVIAGDGPRKENLQQQAADLGISDRVYFTGWREDVENIVPAFDIFLLTSRTEAMPITLLEAMAAAKPVVVPRVGGIPEAVEDGVTGFTYPPGDYEKALELLQRLLDDSTVCREIAKQAAETVATRYSPTAMAKTTGAIYREIAACMKEGGRG